jgi:hypothetical protein
MGNADSKSNSSSQSDGIMGHNILSDINKWLSLTYKHRLYRFAVFGCLGFLFTFIGTLMIFPMNLVGFAVCYTFGNIFMMLATLCAQCFKSAVTV